MTGKSSKGKNRKNDLEVRFYDPPNTLRQKVGMGGINPHILDQAEKFIDANKLDFAPHALAILKKADAAIKKAKAAKVAGTDHIRPISAQIMELKASGAMFKYVLISEIAAVLLNFLENLEELNDDAFEIIDVYQKTLKAIATHRLKGDGGREGKALARELFEACDRYRKKYSVFLDVGS